jgi:preprotein translocase subunit Sec63
MTANEIAVSVVALLLGYWIVAALFERKPKPPAEEPQPTGGSWHYVLNIEANASVEDIKSAYQRLISQYHPDKVASLGQELRELAESKSKEITVAYREAMRSRGVRT